PTMFSWGRAAGRGILTDRAGGGARGGGADSRHRAAAVWSAARLDRDRRRGARRDDGLRRLTRRSGDAGDALASRDRRGFVTHRPERGRLVGAIPALAWPRVPRPDPPGVQSGR